MHVLTNRICTVLYFSMSCFVEAHWLLHPVIGKLVAFMFCCHAQNWIFFLIMLTYSIRWVLTFLFVCWFVYLPPGGSGSQCLIRLIWQTYQKTMAYFEPEINDLDKNLNIFSQKL